MTLPFNKKVARWLDECEEIKLFTKLFGRFAIDISVGKYNAKWAIINDDDHTPYLVRETASARDFLRLRNSVPGNVRRGQKHFKTLGMTFSVVSAEEM